MMGHLNTAEIEKVLQNGVIAHIGCSDGELVYVVPISYVYDHGCVYCLTHEGQKVAILREHPLACFQVEHIHDLANWESVIAQAAFEEILDPVERLTALKKLNDRRLPTITSHTTMLTEEWPFSSALLQNIQGVVFRLRLHNKTGRFEKISHTNSAFY